MPQRSTEALIKQAQSQRKGRRAPANLREQVDPEVVRSWPTPRAGNPGSRPNKKGGKILAEEVKFPTPQNRDWKGKSQRGNHGNTTDYLPNAVEKGQLNPDWVEFLMGWPIGFSDLKPLKGLIWLDWSVDPADENSDDKWQTPNCVDSTGRQYQYSGKDRKKFLTLPGQVKQRQSTGLIPRVTTRKENRINRLKAIGNGQVPQCAATAWRILTNEI